MNKKEAANYLKVSTRAIERYTSKGRLTPAYEPGRTGPAPVYDSTQLDDLRREMETALTAPPVKLDKPAISDKGDTGGALVLSRSGQSAALVELVAAIERARSEARPQAPLEAKLTLNLQEASALSGLSRGYLLEAIKGKKLKARIIGRGWRVKRDDLDSYVKKL
jgi:excisionase family DNA binding protein